jgi:hypothetical protein
MPQKIPPGRLKKMARQLANWIAVVCGQTAKWLIAPWTCDADHFTCDADSDTHTCDGWHNDIEDYP